MSHHRHARFCKHSRWGVLLGAALFYGSSTAGAADLGGNCCADLEERIADLEATTARKGNRKVKLTISGWVNEAVFWWDDGQEHNAYVATNGLEQTRFRFVGEAKIDKDWSAGYFLEIGVSDAVSTLFDQFDSQGAGPALAVLPIVRKSYWYVKNKDYGQVSIGLNGSATYHLLDDADATNTRNFSDAEAAGVAVNNFIIVSNGALNPANLRWRQVLRGFNNDTPGQAGRRQIVRYDTPEFQGFLKGFSFAAAWGADDLWDAAITFNRDIHDFKVLAKAGYGNSTDDFVPPPNDVTSGTLCGGPSPNFECEWAGAAATIMHIPTGLYVYGGFGWQRIDSLPAVIVVGGVPVFPGKTSTTWFVQPGIERKWHPLGKTTIFGEYRHDDPGASLANGAFTFGATSTRGADINFWAAGVVQNVEAAAMDLYAIYRHADGEFVAGQTGVLTPIDNFDMVITGALIKF